MNYDNRSLKFDTQAFPELRRGRIQHLPYLHLIYAGVFIAAWIFAMSLGGS
ncbi:MAG: hypothetical protein JXX14_15845 [Deltaproteobacteria bacterium]|nr:hypothetical protein [Deltaproteobacteria bacterium]